MAKGSFRDVGGPLDGQSSAESRGKAPSYRHDDGRTMRAATGYGVFCPRASRKRHGYVLTEAGGKLAYVHATHADDLLAVANGGDPR